MKKLPFFLLLLILLLEIIISVDSQSPKLMMFVLQWPPTFCMELASGKCKEPIPQHAFILHGLWPADARGKSITDCNRTDPTNWDDVFRPIEDRLVSFWISLKVNSDNRGLWVHEWNKHGKCAGTTAEKYFEAAISINNLIGNRNLFDYLKTNGIIACDSLAFTRAEIVDAVRKVFVKSPSRPPDIYLKCVNISTTNNTHVYLSEVILCTNLTGTGFISCPSQLQPLDKNKVCSGGAKIMLPHPQSQLRAPPPPRRFQEEVYGTYPTFEQSWAKYIFNG